MGYKRVLHAGMSWQVGIGVAISIWNNAWLIELAENKVYHTVRNSEINTVADLIDKNTRLWKEDFITNAFTPEEAT